MTTVIEACTARGFRQMIAVIGDTVNHASIVLHRSLGFVQVGLLPTIGFKFGRWLDGVPLQRPLGRVIRRYRRKAFAIAQVFVIVNRPPSSVTQKNRCAILCGVQMWPFDDAKESA